MSTKIDWTDTTWNPITGCNKISLGCKNCYAEQMSHRLKHHPHYKQGFSTVAIHPDWLYKPKAWKKPKKIFVNSMGDVFHRDAPIDFIEEMFDVMRECPQHSFQVLTKRPKRMLRVCKKLDLPENLWLGITIEHPKYLNRINYLKKTSAKTKFISFEPLLKSIGEIDLSGINWVIVGGESGLRARKMKLKWAKEIRDQCLNEDISFFFKQTSGTKATKKKTLKGKTWHQFPDVC